MNDMKYSRDENRERPRTPSRRDGGRDGDYSPLPRTEGRSNLSTSPAPNNPALSVAVQAARAAGRIINIASNHLDRLVVEKKGHNDFVSEVDKSAEAAIIELIQHNFPTHHILAEESGLLNAAAGKAKAGKHDYCWMIDPLDGTTNFIHGFPQYAVSIALYQGNRPEVAVIYDPNRNELYTAIRGKGALLDQRRIRVSPRHHLPEVLLGTGFPFRQGDDFARYLRQLEEVMKTTSGIRRAGSAALDLAFVAAGRLDGFWEMGLKPWDLAAGVLLIQEAGGIVSEINGGHEWLNSGNLLTANGSLHERLLKRLAAL